MREARASGCTGRYGHRGTRVGEAAHPGPTRRLRRVVGARNVVPRLSTQPLSTAASDDEMPLMRRSTGQLDGLEQDLEIDVPLPQKLSRAKGSGQSVDATPQSIQDREWDEGVETRNRFSPLQDTLLEGMPIVGVSGSNTESDVPSRRRRLRVVWNADPHSEAQTALTLLQVSWCTCPSCNSPSSMVSIVCAVVVGCCRGSRHHPSVGHVGKHSICGLRAHSKPSESGGQRCVQS